MHTLSHQKLWEIFENFPYPVYKQYYNFHHENSFYFSGNNSEFIKLHDDLVNLIKPEAITTNVSTDRYLDFEHNEITDEILNLRIRKFQKGTQNGITNLIALFKSDPGNENVLVVTIDTKCTDKFENKIVDYINQFIKVTKTFSVTKKSITLVIKDPQIQGKELSGEYLNISLDSINNIKIQNTDHRAAEILGYNKIVEVEWNDEISSQLLTKETEKLFSHPLFITRSFPKKQKKSTIINRWIKNSK